MKLPVERYLGQPIPKTAYQEDFKHYGSTFINLTWRFNRLKRAENKLKNEKHFSNIDSNYFEHIQWEMSDHFNMK